MNLPLPRSLLAIPAIALLGLFAPSARAVTITEDFNQYTASDTAVTGLTAVPGYGTTGGGWLQGWRTASTTGATASVKVLNANPVNSGGNYFSATLTSNPTTTGTKDAIGLTKAYDVTGNSLASATAIYTNFDLRVDSITATLQLDILDNDQRGTGNNSGSWQLRAVNGVWSVLNGGIVTSTGMAFTAGTTYSFAIVSNPTNSTWAYTISNGSSSVSGSGLGFRVAGFVTDSTTGGVANSRWFLVAATETTDIASQSTTFSLDNLSISTTSPIPEPSTYAILVGAASLGLVLLDRRRV